MTELTENSCRICGKQCKDQRSLMKHAWDHSKEKKHACVNCGKNFHNKARLRRHMQSHRNKSVTCNICGDVFADGRSLMNHRHSHTNISGRQFPCRECGKTFGSRSSQQIHMRIHTGRTQWRRAKQIYSNIIHFQVSAHMDVDSVGKHLRTVAHYVNTNVFIQVCN